MPRFNSLEEVNQALRSNGDVLSLIMQELRDAYGAQRLGTQVRNGLSNALRSLGIAHQPAELPDAQHEWVIIYRQGTPAERLIEAVLDPGPNSGSILQDAIQAESEQILQKVRELVCG